MSSLSIPRGLRVLLAGFVCVAMLAGCGDYLRPRDIVEPADVSELYGTWVDEIGSGATLTLSENGEFSVDNVCQSDVERVVAGQASGACGSTAKAPVHRRTHLRRYG